MNCIHHFNAFYYHVSHDERLSAPHISVYMALFRCWGYHSFQNPFPIHRKEIMRLSRVGSNNIYNKCIKDLHSFRYIRYHSGIAEYQGVKITMIRLGKKKDETPDKQLDLFLSK